MDHGDWEAIASKRLDQYTVALNENAELQANLYKATTSVRTYNVTYEQLFYLHF